MHERRELLHIEEHAATVRRPTKHVNGMDFVWITVVCERNEFIRSGIGELRQCGPYVAGDLPGTRRVSCTSGNPHHRCKERLRNLCSRE